MAKEESLPIQYAITLWSHLAILRFFLITQIRTTKPRWVGYICCAICSTTARWMRMSDMVSSARHSNCIWRLFVPSCWLASKRLEQFRSFSTHIYVEIKAAAPGKTIASLSNLCEVCAQWLSNYTNHTHTSSNQAPLRLPEYVVASILNCTFC